MKKQEILKIIEEICPSSLQEDWDNCGMQVDAGPEEVSRILLALEASPAVIREAEEKHAQFLLTHHPLLFYSLKKIEPDDTEGRMVLQMVRAGITHYACHTSFDIMPGGNNDDLGAILGMQNIRLLGDDEKICRRGELPEPLPFRTFIGYAAEKLGIDRKFLHACGDPDAMVQRAAWCTGAGAEFIKTAKDAGCELFITGDLKYHDAQAALQQGMNVLDAGHYGTEKIFPANMAEKLRSRIPEEECEILESELDLNPFLC